MTRLIRHPAYFTIALLLAIPLILRADAPIASADKLVYDPPADAHQKTRVLPHVRGGTDIPESVQLTVLSPDHTGYTIQEHPSLFWYLNEPVKGLKYKLTVTKPDEAEPLVEKFLDPEKDTGIQRLDLSTIPKTLENNTEYEINVAIIGHGGGSKDLVAKGMIKRVAAPEKLVSKLLTRPTPGERAFVYARGGIWWDALAALSDQIAADPTNKVLHAQRAELFQKVGLEAAEAYDRKLAK